MPRQPLTEQQAHAIFDILAEHAGAPESMRGHFVAVETDEFCSEFRFQGSLGFGGKFWRSAGAWYVTAYPEDVKRWPYMQQILDDTNRALAALDKQTT